MARVARSTSAETFALGAEKGGKTLVEIGAASVQANGHGGFLGT
jgi:hypothetical protein